MVKDRWLFQSTTLDSDHVGSYGHTEGILLYLASNSLMYVSSVENEGHLPV